MADNFGDQSGGFSDAQAESTPPNYEGAQPGQPYGSMPPGPGGNGHQGPTPRPPGRSTGNTIAIVLAAVLGVAVIGFLGLMAVGIFGILFVSSSGTGQVEIAQDAMVEEAFSNTGEMTEAMPDEVLETMPDEAAAADAMQDDDPVEPVPADSLAPEEPAEEAAPDQPDGSIVTPTSPTEAACILEASGNSLENVFTTLSPEAEKAVIQAALDCLADPASNKDLVESTSEEFEAGFNGEIQLDDAESSCLIRHTLNNTDDPVRALTTSDGPNDEAIISQGIVLCFDQADQEAMIRMMGAG